MDVCFINVIAINYPDHPDYQIVQNYREFFEALQYVIPHQLVRSRYITYLRYHPVEYHLGNRESLMRWVRDLIHPIDANCLDDPKIVWKYLTLIGQRYPIKPDFQEVLLYKNFFLALGNVFPKFRKQYLNYLRAMPVDQYLSSRNYLQQWLHQLASGSVSASGSASGHHDSCDGNLEHFSERSDSFRYVLLAVPVLLVGIVLMVRQVHFRK